MNFFKRHWSTLVLITILAAWIGISLGTNECPSCVVTDVAKGAVSSDRGIAKKEKSTDGKPKLASWTAVDTQGNAITSSDLEGKVSVLVYWATWCGGCKKEIPDLVALRHEFSSSDVEIIGLSVDEAHKDLEAFATEKGINYRLARVTPSVDEAFGRVDAIPTIFILDQEGRIHFRHTGLIPREALSERVRSLLAARNIERRFGS